MKVIVICLLFLLATYASAHTYQKVLLKDVEVLTFKNGELTSGRRVAPIRQMSCIGGSGQKYSHQVESIQCKNVGFDGKDVNWKCEASLPNGLYLGSTVVSCEGFDYPQDYYVLAGSCGVKYNLNGYPVKYSNHDNYDLSDTDPLYGLHKYMTGIMTGLVLVMMYVCCCTSTNYDRENYTNPTMPCANPTTPRANPTPVTHTHTHTEVHHKTSDSGLSFTDGVVFGSLTESLRKRNVAPQKTVIIQQPSSIQPSLIQPSSIQPATEVEYITITEKESDTITSTSHATTERR